MATKLKIQKRKVVCVFSIETKVVGT